jgi:tetratricopeptide (TPR) repeat protein
MCYCVVFLITLVIAAPALNAKSAAKPKGQPAEVSPYAAKLSSDPVTRQGFEHFYNMQYDKAIQDFEKALQAHPDDPFAVNHLLSAVLFKELYRIGALDSEMYSNDSFLTSKQFPIEPKARARILELTDRSRTLCEQRLQANPNDVDALYARGVVRGMRATYIGLVDKAWFSALRNSTSARRDHERVLELKPDYADAKMIVGMHNYMVGSVSWAVRLAASIIGVSGNKSKGFQFLYEAANGGGEASQDAKIALSLFLRREQRYDEAIKIVSGMVSAYPHNFLVALELANLQNAAGHPREAIAAYRGMLDSARQGKYVDPHLDQVAYGLGEALRGQRDFQGAAEAFESVGSYAKIDPELQEKANLAAGEMYDALQKRELAVQKYNSVIAADSSSWRAGVARKHLKEAYRPPKA